MGLSAAAGGRGHGVWDSPRPGSEAWPGQVLKGDLSARGLGFSAQGWGAPGVTRGHEDNTQSRSPNTSAHTALPFKTSGTQKTGLGKKPEDRCSQPHPPAPGTLTEFASPSFYLQTPRTSSSKPRKTPRTNLAGRPSVSKSSAGGDKQSLPHTSDWRPLPPQHWNRVARATRPTASPFACATFADEVTAATGSGSQQPCVNPAPSPTDRVTSSSRLALLASGPAPVQGADAPETDTWPRDQEQRVVRERDKVASGISKCVPCPPGLLSHTGDLRPAPATCQEKEKRQRHPWPQSCHSVTRTQVPRQRAEGSRIKSRRCGSGSRAGGPAAGAVGG